MKKFINISFIYAMAAIACGVFYREFTKYMGFSGKTTLAFTHLHLFVLGTILFLIIAIFTYTTDLENQKNFNKFMTLYNIGLPFMVLMFFIRGILQVLGTEITKGVDATVSGVSGIVHILMTVSIIYLFSALKKSIPTKI